MKKTKEQEVEVITETKPTLKRRSLKKVDEVAVLESITVSAEKIEPIIEEVINDVITVGDIIGRNYEVNSKVERQVGLIDIFRQLRMVSDEHTGGKFAYFTKRNLDFLVSTWSFIQRENKSIFVSKYSKEEHQAYQNTYSELEKDVELAEKNARDKWMKDGIIIDEEKFYEELDSHKSDIEKKIEPFKHIVQENLVREEAFDKLLSVEVNLKKHKIDMEYLPKGINGYQFDRIYSYINNVE